MVNIDVVSDLVCPWCFIGKRRLTVALATVRRAHPEFACQIRWQPFFLNPDTPPEGEPYLPFLEKKFASRERVEALFSQVRAAGQPYGLTYAFEKIQLRANTLKAHRLLHWAQQRETSEATIDALVEGLFVAQFQRGEALGELDTLATIAEACGLPKSEVRAYLASDQDEAQVREKEQSYRQRGISMVPSFIVQNENIIVGAEDPSVLANAIARWC